jgi:pectinesterase
MLVVFVFGFLLIYGCTAKTVSDFTIDYSKVKLEYEIGDELNLDNLIVKVKYSDSSEVEVKDNYRIDSSAFDSSKPGTYVIKVGYSHFDDKAFEVKVNPKPMSIVLDTSNVKKEFVLNSSFTSEGLIVKIKYSDNSTKSTTSFTIDSSMFDNTKTGTYSIKVKSGKFEATYDVSVVAPKVIGIELDTTNAVRKFAMNESFTIEGLVVKEKYDNSTTKVINDFTVDFSAFSTTPGTYTIKIMRGEFSATYDVSVENVMLISTPDDVINMINNPITTTYKLANDIDMSGITTLKGGAKNFAGTFDGNGYTISGLNVTATGNKMGIFFKEALAGSIFKDLKFADSIYYGGGSGEASAFIVAYAHGGSTFDNIAFENVTVSHNGSYAALLFGDTKEVSSLPITISRISVINDEMNEVRGSSYIGGLIGRLNHALKVDISNVYFSSQVRAGSVTDGVYTPDQACGLLIGRVNAADITININNTVVNGTIVGSKNVGLVGTTVANSTLNTNGLFVNSLLAISGSNKVDVLVGNVVAGFNINAVNTYYNADKVELYKDSSATTKANPTQGSPITSEMLTQTWFESSTLSTTYFKLVGDNIVLNSETGGEVKETGFTVVTTNVDKLYVVGEPLNLDGLSVKANMSDGSKVNLEMGDYTVDTSNFNNLAAGTYEIIVRYKDYTPISFEVEVVAVTGFKVYDNDVVKTYLKNSSFSSSNLIVKAVLSDNSELRLSSTDYTVDSSLYNAAAAGEYDIKVSYKDYPVQIIKVTVVDFDKTTITDKINLSIDAQYTGVDGVVDTTISMLKFKSVKSALDFINALNLDASVDKNFYFEAGVYKEKITISAPNITFIGIDATTTKITFDVRSGDFQANGSTWGTQGSASVTIKSSAKNFMATKITFENSYDYFGGIANGITNDVQAVALVTEADQVIFNECRFIGAQDTLYAKGGRQYYYKCYIEGVVDFIFGNEGPAYFEECVIHSLKRSTGCITANKGTGNNGAVTYGYVFYKCILTAEEGTPANSVDLGRPWDKTANVAYIECIFGDHITARGWTDMSGNLPENAYFYEYGNVNAQGELIVRTEVYKGKTLTAEQANNYKSKAVVLGSVNGTANFGEWDFAADLAKLVG